VNTWLISCHSVLAQWNSPGVRPDGLSMATTLPERHAERAQSGHAQRAYGEVFVIGIDFHLHRRSSLILYFFS
jgi:hypothetical protein